MKRTSAETSARTTGAALVAALFLSSAPASAQPLAGDATRGERIFQWCAACHDLKPAPETTPQGPPLAGVVNRRIGNVTGFGYSASLMDLAAREKTWTPALLDRYLAAPWRLAPKTTMSFPGLADAQERADVIAFLAGAR
jgi:cytochrome c